MPSSFSCAALSPPVLIGGDGSWKLSTSSLVVSLAFSLSSCFSSVRSMCVTFREAIRSNHDVTLGAFFLRRWDANGVLYIRTQAGTGLTGHPRAATAHIEVNPLGGFVTGYLLKGLAGELLLFSFLFFFFFFSFYFY